MLLYHFNIDGSGSSVSYENAAGLGHAVRCRELSNQFPNERVYCVNNNKSSIEFCESVGCKYIFEDNLDEFLASNAPIAIISDINYLGENIIDIYRRHDIPTVCLAPRGNFKYQATLAFCDFEDPLCKNKLFSYNNELRIGFEYAFIRSEIAVFRKIDNFKRKKNQILVSMGGADTFDTILNVIEYLQRLPSHFNVKIILGNFYQKPDYVLQLCSKYLSCEFEVLISPSDFSVLLSESTFGIFGTGIVTYEAMCLGVIPFNISVSDFHTSKATMIQELGAGFYVGDVREKNTCFQFIEIIQDLQDDEILQCRIRQKAMDLIDGDGQNRIVSEISQKLLR